MDSLPWFDIEVPPSPPAGVATPEDVAMFRSWAEQGRHLPPRLVLRLLAYVDSLHVFQGPIRRPEAVTYGDW